jgi:hypothetical protein
MAFADPQSVTIAGAPVSLPRVGSGVNTGSFKTNDGTVTLTVSSSYGKRTRRTLRLEHNKIAADPFTTGASTKVSMTTYLVTDTPVNGYTVAQQKEIVDAIVAYLASSTGARVTQLLGGEN